MDLKIKISPDKCTGCKACLIACSYHHYGYFSKNKGSIALIEDDKFLLRPIIFHYDDGVHKICDFCINEKEPLCVKFCKSGALRILESES